MYNTTRFNSWLRDVLKLCEGYGGKAIELFVGEEGNGFTLNGEIIYYEDVYDMIPENLRYKGFECNPDFGLQKYLNELVNGEPL